MVVQTGHGTGYCRGCFLQISGGITALRQRRAALPGIIMLISLRDYHKVSTTGGDGHDKNNAS
jgi:hypothetical protein